MVTDVPTWLCRREEDESKRTEAKKAKIVRSSAQSDFEACNLVPVLSDRTTTPLTFPLAAVDMLLTSFRVKCNLVCP